MRITVRLAAAALTALVLLAAVGGAAAQQFPVMDMIANRIIEKYQGSTCEQLWQERSQGRGQPKPSQEQQAIHALQNNPQMRAAFIDKVAAPIANKLFDCGMIP